MEIQKNKYQHFYTCEFKIDLIVWKCYISQFQVITEASLK